MLRVWVLRVRMLRNKYQIGRRRALGASLLFAAALFADALFAAALGGCSSIGTPSPTASDPAAAPPPPSPSLSEKFSSFFSNASQKSPQAVANGQAEQNCPSMDIRPGASTLSIGPTGDNTAMMLKYQGTFVRAARECAAAAGNMVIRVGVEGRIVLGPAGGPGQVDVPLRIAVVDETPTSSKTIITKLVHVPVTVASMQDNPTFTHIEEGLTFPMPKPADLDNYIIYIGFDPLAVQEKPKPEAKPKPKKRPGTG